MYSMPHVLSLSVVLATISHLHLLSLRMINYSILLKGFLIIRIAPLAGSVQDYLVKCLGYGPENSTISSTWEPESSLSNSSDLIAEYWTFMDRANALATDKPASKSVSRSCRKRPEDEFLHTWYCFMPGLATLNLSCNCSCSLHALPNGFLCELATPIFWLATALNAGLCISIGYMCFLNRAMLFRV